MYGFKNPLRTVPWYLVQGVPLYRHHLPKCAGEKVRADYKLMVMPTSLLVFHSFQARFRVYLYGAPSPVKIVCRGLELFPLENTTRNGPFREPRQACLPSSQAIFSEENIHALTITMRVIPVRFRIMVAGRANHRNGNDVPRASLYPAPGTVQYSQNL